MANHKRWFAHLLDARPVRRTYVDPDTWGRGQTHCPLCSRRLLYGILACITQGVELLDALPTSELSELNMRDDDSNEDVSNTRLLLLRHFTRGVLLGQISLRQVYSKLRNEIFELEDIRQFKDVDWEKMEISIGLERRLFGGKKIF